MRWILVMVFWAGALSANPVDDVAVAAQAAFDRMPRVMRVAEIAGRCGAGPTVNTQAAYCTTRNTIFLTRAAASLPQAPYLVAHLYGHAVQVQHGIADIALREIRSRRSEEQALRGMVARQVDCIAGFLMAEAALPPARLIDWFETEPFTGSHWGRNPLSIGPKVGIGLEARETWFGIGQGGDLSACAPGEFTADLLVRAHNDLQQTR